MVPITMVNNKIITSYLPPESVGGMRFTGPPAPVCAVVSGVASASVCAFVRTRGPAVTARVVMLTDGGGDALEMGEMMW